MSWNSRVFTYHDEIPEMNVDKYWKQFNKKKNGQVEVSLTAEGDGRSGSEHCSPGDAAEVKLRKIYDRVQEIHNLTTCPGRRLKSANTRDQGNNNVKNYGSTNMAMAGTSHGCSCLCGVQLAGGLSMPVSGRSEYFFNKELSMGENWMQRGAGQVNGKEEFFDPELIHTIWDASMDGNRGRGTQNRQGWRKLDPDSLPPVNNRKSSEERAKARAGAILRGN